MTRLIKKLDKTEKTKKFILGGILFVVVFSGILHIYFTTAIIIKTAERNKDIKEIKIVNREYQETEEVYLGLVSTFTLDYAYSLGFIEQKERSFATKRGVMASR